MFIELSVHDLYIGYFCHAIFCSLIQML